MSQRPPRGAARATWIESAVKFASPADGGYTRGSVQTEIAPVSPERSPGTHAPVAVSEPRAPSPLRRLRAALRFDGLWWRKFARLGAVYGPEWWTRVRAAGRGVHHLPRSSGATVAGRSRTRRAHGRARGAGAPSSARIGCSPASHTAWRRPWSTTVRTPSPSASTSRRAITSPRRWRAGAA